MDSSQGSLKRDHDKEIDGKTNSADIGTKVLTEKEYNKLMAQLGFEYRD